MLNNGHKVTRTLTAAMLSLLIIFLLIVSEVNAWSSRNSWICWIVKNKLGATVGITVDGAIVGKSGSFEYNWCPECLKGFEPHMPPHFPDCFAKELVIDKWGVGKVTGYYFGTSATPYLSGRWIGIGCRICVGRLEKGVWLDGNVPKGWFPVIGFACASPVSFVVGDSIPKPYTVANVEYAIAATPVPFDTFNYYSPLPWQPTTLPASFPVNAGDSILISGIPSDSQIADSVLFLRGLLIVEVESDFSTYVDTVYFAGQIFEHENIPTLSPWGLIIFSLLLLATIVWYLRRRRPVPASISIFLLLLFAISFYFSSTL